MQARSQQLRGRAGRQARPDRQPSTEPLGHRHHIGCDAVVLMREKRSSAAHPGLHLVEDQQRAVPGSDIARRRQIAIGRHHDAALPHDRLQENRSGVVTDRGRQRVGVAVGHVGDVAGQRRERRLLTRLAGQSQGAHRPAVETTLRRNQFRAAGQPGQLERRLVGLGAGVAEQHPGLGVGTEQTGQRLGQRDARLGGIQV